MILKYLITKEFKQFMHNPFMPKVVVMMPLMLMLVFPWAATQEVKNAKLVFVDHDHSTESRRLIDKTVASGYFIPEAYTDSYSEAAEIVKKGNADIILEIAPDFAKNLGRNEAANVKISANAVNGTKGLIGASYLQQIISDFDNNITMDKGVKSLLSSMTLSERFVFNPTLDYKHFMIPAFMVMLLTLLLGFLPALNIVSEKEKGTIEQINVSPVSRMEFILGKLIPYWIIGFLVINFAMLLAWVAYGFEPVGSLFSIYVFTMVYISLISGFGLLISNYSDTMQQAMFVMFFFMLVLMLMSGLYTPVASMPKWARTVDIFNPTCYYIDAMRMIFLKSSSVSQLFPKFLNLMIFALVFNSWAIFSYKKNS